MTAEPDTTRTRLTANILTALADENTRLRAAGQQLADALSGPTWHFHDPYAGSPRIEDCEACAALQGWEDATGEQTP